MYLKGERFPGLVCVTLYVLTAFLATAAVVSPAVLFAVEILEEREGSAAGASDAGKG